MLSGMTAAAAAETSGEDALFGITALALKERRKNRRAAATFIPENQPADTVAV